MEEVIYDHRADHQTLHKKLGVILNLWK